MGSIERRERERQELRTRILDAARELFVKQGYEAVTMREIAKRIEYSPTAIYNHFADKETLVRELCREDFAAFAQRLVEEVAASGDVIERMCRAGISYLAFAERYPEHYRMMFMTELPPTPPEGHERSDPTQNAYVFLRALVDELFAHDALRPGLGSPDLVAQTVWAAVHGAAALDLIVHKSETWLDFASRRERFTAALELILRGLLKDPEAGSQTLARVLAERRGKKES